MGKMHPRLNHALNKNQHKPRGTQNDRNSRCEAKPDLLHTARPWAAPRPHTVLCVPLECWAETETVEGESRPSSPDSHGVTTRPASPMCHTGMKTRYSWTFAVRIT